MSDKIQEIKDVFQTSYDEVKREKLLLVPSVQARYLIAFTPRSGSSYLCDVLKRVKLFGKPDEFVSGNFLPNIRQRTAPSTSPEDYIDLVLRASRTPNGVSGFKASWFQFNNFMEAMTEPESFAKFKFIHLTRRDIAAQAVSLYRATATGVFHTNIEHGHEKLEALGRLEYDFDKIEEWCRHIEVQEDGWRNYFAMNNIFPLTITYEEVNADVLAVVKRIAHYLGRPRAAERITTVESVFQKIGQRQSVEWSCRFVLERDERKRQNEQKALETQEIVRASA